MSQFFKVNFRECSFRDMEHFESFLRSKGALPLGRNYFDISGEVGIPNRCFVFGDSIAAIHVLWIEEINYIQNTSFFFHKNFRHRNVDKVFKKSPLDCFVVESLRKLKEDTVEGAQTNVS